MMADEQSTTIYAGQLAWATTEEILTTTFSKYGKVISAKIPRDDRNRSKGFGFVKFDNVESATKACELDGTELEGRKIKVNISHTRPTYAPK